MTPTTASATPAVKRAVAITFACLVAGAWVFASMRLPAYVMPSPADVGTALLGFATDARRFGHLLATLRNVAASIALSFAIGAVLALVAHSLRWTDPTIHRRLSPFLNSFSGIGWTLLAVIWFGVSMTTVVFSISAVLLPFALVNLREGLAALDRELGEMAASFTRRRGPILVAIVLPALVPFAIATLRIMFGVSWKVTLTAELFGGNEGLGYLINLSRQEFDTATIFAVILLIVAAVYSADRWLLGPLQRVVTRRSGGMAESRR